MLEVHKTHSQPDNRVFPLSVSAWMGDLGEEFDEEKWVNENLEILENAREQAYANTKRTQSERKKTWDKKAKVREFGEEEKVLLRTPGMGSQFSESWEGLFIVKRSIGPRAYELDIDWKKTRIAHLRFLMKYKEAKVKTVTTVIDLERNDDSIDDCGGGVKIEGMVEQDAKAIDIAKWENDYKDVLTEEPGLTNLTKFSIDTSDSRPIQQHPYSVPVSLRKAVDEELDSLIDKGYIRQSESKWGSPMVVVKKPNGKVRLCIDYRKVNGVTTDEPFYMPRVDEAVKGDIQVGPGKRVLPGTDGR